MAIVVPKTNDPMSRLRSRSVRRSASKHASDGSDGVELTLRNLTSPSGETATRSVKVPPVSTPMRPPPIAADESF